MTNQLAGSYVKIVGKIEKFSRELGREQKFRRTWYSLSRKHPLCSLKKPTGNGSQRTVHKPRTNYINIVSASWFTNKMFTSVYAALQLLALGFFESVTKVDLSQLVVRKE